MGTPAFPDLGKHCSVSDCQQLDFLPFTCDCCHQVYCLDHRSYRGHRCPKGNKHDVTVVVCPLCAKGVRLHPDENPNITWESHVNTECDPSSYDVITKKKRCPVKGCKEVLTFSNKIKCRDCSIEHCLKHRFGLDHKCPGPKKPEPSFQFMGFLNQSKKEEPKRNQVNSSEPWTTSLWKAASSAFGLDGGTQGSSSRTGTGGSGTTSGRVEQCPRCSLRFTSVATLVEHVEKVHERNGVMKVTLDICPKCGKGFRDPVALVEHVEREHRGTSKA